MTHYFDGKELEPGDGWTVTDEQRAELIDWLSGVLKPEFDPVRYAGRLIEETDPTVSDRPHFEVRGFNTKSGNSETASF